MSEIMLHGVLNMPPELWNDASPIDVMQRHARYVQASKYIDELERELTAVTEQRDQYKAALQSAGYHNHELATKLEIVAEQRDKYHDYWKSFGEERIKLKTELAAVTEQRDSIDSMYHKVIKEVLECDPIPACQRKDDQLESPWEVIARVREQRDRLAEALKQIQGVGLVAVDAFDELDRIDEIVDEALQSLNQNQPALPTASATPLHP